MTTALVATLLDIVLPVFLVIAAGHAAVRLRVLTETDPDALIRFAVRAAVPCLLFLAMFRLDLSAALRVDHIVAYFATATVVFVGAFLVSRFAFGRRPGEAVVAGFSAFFANSVMMGLPIAERAYGDAVLDPAYALMTIHAPYFYIVGILSMELIRRDGAPISAAVAKAVGMTVTNPLMIGLGLGLAANLASLRLPVIVEDGIGLLASAALPAALFALGGVLTRYSLGAELGEASVVSVFSLIVHPALAWGICGPLGLGLPEPFVRAAVVMAAMPVGINGYIFAAMYNRAMGTTAATVLMSTTLSIATIPVWLALLGGTGTP